MKIGVMSDTHGSLDMMRKAANKMIDQFHVDTIIHLGDDSADVEELSSLPVALHWVPGVFESRYQNPGITNRLIKEFEEIPFLLTHTPTRDSHDLDGDIDPTEAIEDGDVKVVLHGHTHSWKICEEKGIIIINPGHLKDKDSKGDNASFAILDLSSAKLDVKIYSMPGEVLAEKTFFFAP